MADSQNELHACKSVFKTDVSESSYDFKWTVTNFNKLPDDLEVHSPQFRPLRQSIWNATIIKTKSDNDGYLTLNTGNEKERVRISKISGTGFPEVIPVMLVKFNHTKLSNFGLELIIEAYDIKGESQFKKMPLSFLSASLSNKNFYLKLREMYAYNLLELESVVFVFNMKFIETITNGFSDHSPRISKNDCLNSLSKDFKNMCDLSLFRDVVLKVKEVSFPAHKSVLSARSAYFKNMFLTNMKEADANEVEIVGIEADVFKCILEYLYSGILPPVDFCIAHDLYYAAHKYCLFELCQICRDILMPTLSINNAEHFMRIAELHNDKDMLEQVIEFLKCNIKDIDVTDKVRETLVKDLSKVEIIELMKNVFLRKCEYNDK